MENAQGVFIKPSLRELFHRSWEQCRVILFSAPFGVGKTTAAHALLKGKRVAAFSAALTVSTGVGNVSFDSKSLNALVTAKENKAVQLSIETVKPETLSESQKAVLGEKTKDAVVIDLNLTVGGSKVSRLGGTATVSIPCPKVSAEKAENLVVWFLADDGSITPCAGSYNAATGQYDFQTNHFSAYVLTEFPFADVKSDAWYYGDAAYCYMNGLMSGVRDTAFEPTRAASRGMIVTILYRMENSPAVEHTNAFSDVEEGAYDYDAILWAQANGIAGGYADGTFRPDAPVTREQLAAILYHDVQRRGGGFTGSWMFPLDFTDAADVSEWADEAMHWCVMNGLLNGSDGKLLPQGSATRAQMAAVLHRFCEKATK
jgi:hypothetical protein